jgi:hypothetical protein
MVWRVVLAVLIFLVVVPVLVIGAYDIFRSNNLRPEMCPSPDALPVSAECPAPPLDPWFS